jgi:hypothetical protein
MWRKRAGRDLETWEQVQWLLYHVLGEELPAFLIELWVHLKSSTLQDEQAVTSVVRYHMVFAPSLMTFYVAAMT